MTVPKATMNKDYSPTPGKDKIRFAWKLLPMKAISVP